MRNLKEKCTRAVIYFIGLIVLALGIIGIVFTGHIIGLGIGTILAVIFTGRVIAVYNYFLKHSMQNIAGITTQLE